MQISAPISLEHGLAKQPARYVLFKTTSIAVVTPFLRGQLPCSGYSGTEQTPQPLRAAKARGHQPCRSLLPPGAALPWALPSQGLSPCHHRAFSCLIPAVSTPSHRVIARFCYLTSYHHLQKAARRLLAAVCRADQTVPQRCQGCAALQAPLRSGAPS